MYDMQTLSSQPILPLLHEPTQRLVNELISEGYDPHLGAILVGQNPASLKYLEIKSDKAKVTGLILSLYQLHERSTQAEIAETIGFLAADPEMAGVIIQLPLPPQFSSEQVDALLKLVPRGKDVDALANDWLVPTPAPLTIAELMASETFYPPMVCGVISLLDYYHIDLRDKKIVLVGEGRLVGKPLLRFFQGAGLDVTAVNDETERIIDITSQADILITGTGQKDMITYQWVKEGAVVIDCSGDVHADSVSQVASALSPGVGGIGPLTVAWLLYNTAQAANRNYHANP